jgi:hypothetical protein
MKFEGKIYRLHSYGMGGADPRVQARLEGYVQEDMPGTDDTKSRMSKCSVKLKWTLPQEYGDHLRIGQVMVVNIRAYDSDFEKHERGEELE